MTARDAVEADLGLVAEICVGGFSDDPVMRWVFPDPAERGDGLRVAFAGLARSYLVEHSVLHIVDDGCVTMWRAPAFQPAPDEGAPVGESPFSPDVQERFRILGEGMAAVHPHEPHWYLNVISTLPSRQGRGLGARALRPVLERCDADHMPAYLESSNPRNMTLYRRHDFVEIGEIGFPDGPSLYPMWREPH